MGGFSVRYRGRTIVVCAVLLVLTAVVGIFSMTTGDYPLGPGQVFRALIGQGQGLDSTVVLQWRLPRVTAAIVLGAALGMSGAIFQSLTRNPLGSPDIIGFNTGAYTGALVIIAIIGGGFTTVALGALVGGLVTALLVYVLARTRHGTGGLRLIIVGIGVSGCLAAVNHWIVLQADLDTAMSAAVWGAGSLNGIRWPQIAIAAWVSLALMVCAALASRTKQALDLGDDVGTALGVRVEPARIVLLFLGVGLTAAATAVAGPIAFVALVAPQVGMRLARTAGPALGPAAATGALLLTAADFAGQRLFAPTQVPVGVMTVSLGGTYLVWLLFKEARR